MTMHTLFTHFAPLNNTDLGIASSDAHSFADFIVKEARPSQIRDASSRPSSFRPYVPQPAVVTPSISDDGASLACPSGDGEKTVDKSSILRMPSASDFTRSSVAPRAAFTAQITASPPPLQPNFSRPIQVAPCTQSSQPSPRTPRHAKRTGWLGPPSAPDSSDRTGTVSFSGGMDGEAMALENTIARMGMVSDALVKLRYHHPECVASSLATTAHHTRSVSTGDVPSVAEMPAHPVQLAARPKSAAVDSPFRDEKGNPLTSYRAGPTDLPAMLPQPSGSSKNIRSKKSAPYVMVEATRLLRRMPALKRRSKQVQEQYYAQHDTASFPASKPTIVSSASPAEAGALHSPNRNGSKQPTSLEMPMPPQYADDPSIIRSALPGQPVWSTANESARAALPDWVKGTGSMTLFDELTYAPDDPLMMMSTARDRKTRKFLKKMAQENERADLERARDSHAAYLQEKEMRV